MYIKIKDVIKMNRLHKQIEKTLKKIDKDVYIDICLNNKHLLNALFIFYDFSGCKKITEYKSALERFCNEYKLNKDLTAEEIAKILSEK